VGFVVNNSASALAEAVQIILQDKGARERFRNSCKSVIKNFDVSKMVLKLEEVCNEVAKDLRNPWIFE